MIYLKHVSLAQVLRPSGPVEMYTIHIRYECVVLYDLQLIKNKNIKSL